MEWDADVEMPRRTVTVSWWLVGVVGAVLMASGAAAAAMLKLRAAPAPRLSRPRCLSGPPRPHARRCDHTAPVIVQPLAPPPPPSQVAPAEAPAPVVRPVPAARTARPTAIATAPARRAPLSPPKRSVAPAASAPRSKVWVDPFAE